MTFFGYDLKNFNTWYHEDRYVRYCVSPALMDLFSNTNAASIPFDVIKLPYDYIFIEVNDRVSPDIVVCGVMANNPENWWNGLHEIHEEKLSNFVMRPIFKMNGFVCMPVQFEIYKEGNTIADVKVDWSTPTKNALDLGLYENHPLVKRSSWYCWLLVSMVCIYVTCSDADIILGINTKEYRKLASKKNPPKAKLEQIKNTRHIGTKIVINRKIEERNLLSKGGTHASPVPHWRSGHFRHLDEGKVVWVRPCIVGYGNGNDKRIPVLKKYMLE